MAELATPIRKPSLREILAEPIVRAVMARDGVSGGDVTVALARARRGTSGAPPRQREPEHSHA